MSRAAHSTPVVRHDARSSGGGGAQDGELLPSHFSRSMCLSSDSPPEVCPVCKSSRYLNANLRLLVNPECYHKMCESCVDRLFSHGPKPCPIPGCSKTLRRVRFRRQTFEDIQVEREVDIRRRVAAVFNRREEDFETLRDWNDYLNMVEDITFNLVNSIDVEETERKLDRHRQAHQKEIAENATLAEQETLTFSALQKAEKAQAKQRREAARREEAEERRELEEQKRDALRRLESGEDPKTVAQEVQGPTLKKRLNRQAAAERHAQLHASGKTNGSGSGLLIRGLKTKVKVQPEAPVDPFGGARHAAHKYHTIQDDYVWTVLQDTKKDALVTAGGYDIGSFTGRALCEAFAGLGVFIADEIDEQERIITRPGNSAGRDEQVIDPC